jgi:hypothetical protein
MDIKNEPLLPQQGGVRMVTSTETSEPPDGQTLATRDHEVIRRWATLHQAEPATGEATRSGPATVNVNDGSVGIRFNFPGFGPFRSISWAEWLEHLDHHELTFVYENVPHEEQSHGPRYRIVKTADWEQLR